MKRCFKNLEGQVQKSRRRLKKKRKKATNSKPKISKPLATPRYGGAVEMIEMPLR